MLRPLLKSDIVVKGNQVNSGEFVLLPARIQCCDCGLNHMIDAKVKGGKVYVRFVVYDSGTNRVRAHMKKVSFGKK